jgi:hypothetical protein
MFLFFPQFFRFLAGFFAFFVVFNSFSRSGNYFYLCFSLFLFRMPSQLNSNLTHFLLRRFIMYEEGAISFSSYWDGLLEAKERLVEMTLRCLDAEARAERAEEERDEMKNELTKTMVKATFQQSQVSRCLNPSE